MMYLCVIALAMLVTSIPAWGQNAEDSMPACAGASANPPLMTYDEQVKYLANPMCRTSLLDSVRFIPLKADDFDYYLSLGFWIRERGEYATDRPEHRNQHPEWLKDPEYWARVMNESPGRRTSPLSICSSRPWSRSFPEVACSRKTS